MNSTARGPRSRWVGPPVPAPKSKLSRSPFGRQRHYGAVELAGAGEQVNVNDVVEVTENKQLQETSQRHPVLVQVLSMWEDTFTGVFKFRARWLVQASDLPADTLPRQCASRQASTDVRSATGSKMSPNKYQLDADEVFLSNRVKDLEVRCIIKPITLCVSTNTTTDVPPGRKGKIGPRLTHAFCDKSGDIHPLKGTDPILKRARVRQANAVALASRTNQENELAKGGKSTVKSNGWLLPKRGAFQRRGGRDGARVAGGVVEIVASSSNSTESALSQPNIDIEASDDSATEEPPNSEDGEWKEGEKDEHDDATDSDFRTNSKATLSVREDFTPRKSARQRKSQRSPAPDASLASDAGAKYASEARVEECSEAKVEASSETQVEDSSEAHAEVCSEAKMEDSSKAKMKHSFEAQEEDCSELTVEERSQANVCSPPSTSATTFQRRLCVSSNKRRGPLPPRSRRLAMPPMVRDPLIAHVCEVPPLASAKAPVEVKVVLSVKTRMSMGLRPKSTPALTRSFSVEDVGKASPQLSTAAKRKRSGAAKTSQGANRSDYPPLRTPVGKDFQTDIPDLLSAEKRKQPHTGTGAKMVWRSVQDWDPQSRGMLAGYLHAAKGVVEAKQARPGVAVHVRLGGKKGSSGVDIEDNTGIANSYAVWAISSGREVCGLVRVACSDMAQTDIPKSAVQRVQSQEQALSALVNARCVLDNFEPALQILANDEGSPESIEAWTLKQVRTLEKALVEDYDPNRRLHGWARPGMDMDREDFIDLATVSKQVPGKTPSQVLSFYYKYLAAAEPLTDVVYGPEAAKARKQEGISSVHEVDAALPGNDRLTKGNTHATKPKTPAGQVSPALCNVGPANTSTNAPESTPKPKPRVIRLSAPTPIESVVRISERNDGTSVDSIPNDDRSTKCDPSPPAKDTVSPSPEASPTPRSLAVSKRATNGDTPGGDDHPCNADGGTVVEACRQGQEGQGLGGASEYFIQQRKCAVREKAVSRIPPPVPPDAEVLEVEDSDDANREGVNQKSWLASACGGREPNQTSDMEVAARHINAMGPAGLSWVARQMRRQAASAESRPSGVLPMPPRSGPRRSVIVEGQRTRRSDDARYGSHSEPPVSPSAQREQRGEKPPDSHSIRYKAKVRRSDDGPSGGQTGSADLPSNGWSGTEYGSRRNDQVGSEPALRDDMFGSMAPCWRLLERAQAFMDKDQLEYMEGLILTHVRKPMSRDQLLERAESCLQEQEKIFSAFVKMFDRIDQPPQVPLYPAKRPLHPRPQSTSYSLRRSLDANPIHDSPHGLQPPQLRPPRAFQAQQRGPYSMRPVHDSGDRGSPISTPSHPYIRVTVPEIGRVEVRPSIHPYDHNGAGGRQGGSVGNRGSNDTVGTKSEPPPHPLSPGPHRLYPSGHPAGYQESRPGASHGGGARMPNAWSQQRPGEWHMATASSTAAAAAAPCIVTRNGSRGPAWSGGGEGT